MFGAAGDRNAQCLASCSLAPDCAALLREGCTTTPETCGICLSGTIGSPGHGNQPCFASVLIAYTGFEQPVALGGSRIPDYIDELDQSQDHEMVNNADQNPISFIGDQELGFSTLYFVVDGGSRGLSHGAPFGVVSDSMSEQHTPHSGNQYFIMANPQNFVVLQTDNVDLTQYKMVRVSILAYVAATRWESSDHVKVWIEDASNGEETVLVEGRDIDRSVQVGSVSEGTWTEYAANSTYDVAKVMLGLNSQNDDEYVLWDDITFTGYGPARTICSNTAASLATDCPVLSRSSCSNTVGLCGPCSHGFVSASGTTLVDGNDTCTVQCDTAPNCTDLFRNPCTVDARRSGTCSSCVEGHIPIGSRPNDAANTRCFAAGCTDQLAVNYDERVEVDDGLCVYDCRVLAAYYGVSVGYTCTFSAGFSIGDQSRAGLSSVMQGTAMAGFSNPRETGRLIPVLQSNLIVQASSELIFRRISAYGIEAPGKNKEIHTLCCPIKLAQSKCPRSADGDICGAAIFVEPGSTLHLYQVHICLTMQCASQWHEIALFCRVSLWDWTWTVMPTLRVLQSGPKVRLS